MRSTMGRQAYSSDLTDKQWEILRPLIPLPSLQGRPPTVERREIVNAILYVLRSGCPWRLLPHEFPAWGTVYYYFRRWQREGVWEQILHTLRRQVRRKQGREEEPSAAIIDSQSIKTSAVRGPQKGYDMGKKTWGRKRHALVDTQGHLLAVKVTGAEKSDQEGGRALLLPLKDTLFPKGFRPQPRRWVVERTFSWIIRWRRLCRDHEGLPSSSEALIKIAMSNRMLNILAPPHFLY